MKKILLLIMLFPSIVFGYSDYLILGGDTLGLEVNSDGVVVVGFYEVNGRYINKHLKNGDRILSVNNEEVGSSKDLVLLIDKYMDDNKVNITYVRDDIEKYGDLNLSYVNGTYKTGLYVKGSILGIGTLTYVDPNTKVYGILGHVLSMSSTNRRIEVKNGYSYGADVVSFTRSHNGSPGSKNANIDKDDIFGNIVSNTNYGVFGTIEKEIDGDIYKVGNINDVKLGEAYIYTSNVDDEVKKYKINILSINQYSSDKNYYFEIVDKDLLNMSGGIVQGMSGSPIVQGDNIIGAVTRVLVDDVTKGYGLDIVTMLEEGDKILEGR